MGFPALWLHGPRVYLLSYTKPIIFSINCGSIAGSVGKRAVEKALRGKVQKQDFSTTLGNSRRNRRISTFPPLRRRRGDFPSSAPSVVITSLPYKTVKVVLMLQVGRFPKPNSTHRFC